MTEPRAALTPRQRAILEAIPEIVRRKGYPSLRAIGALVGLSSSSSVKYQIQELEKRGWITRTEQWPHQPEVKQPGPDAVELRSVEAS